MFARTSNYCAIFLGLSFIMLVSLSGMSMNLEENQRFSDNILGASLLKTTLKTYLVNVDTLCTNTTSMEISIANRDGEKKIDFFKLYTVIDKSRYYITYIPESFAPQFIELIRKLAKQNGELDYNDELGSLLMDVEYRGTHTTKAIIKHRQFEVEMSTLYLPVSKKVILIGSIPLVELRFVLN